MAQDEATVFTVGVFKDMAWASRAIEALKARGFTPAGLTLLAQATPDTEALFESVHGAPPERMDLPVTGATVARGALLAVLNGAGRDLSRIGLAAAATRAGFQSHDGLIYETLVARGGILIATDNTPRAADALAVMQSFGGGNAAIGAWAGRLQPVASK
jgi:hypothetical protein